MVTVDGLETGRGRRAIGETGQGRRASWETGWKQLAIGETGRRRRAIWKSADGRNDKKSERLMGSGKRRDGE